MTKKKKYEVYVMGILYIHFMDAVLSVSVSFMPRFVTCLCLEVFSFMFAKFRIMFCVDIVVV